MPRKNRLSEKSFKCKNLLGEVVTVKPYWKAVGCSPRRKTSFRDRYIDIPEFGLKAVVNACGRGKEVRCPISWFCVKFKREIIVSGDSFPSSDSGFICDCGKWVNGADSGHTNVVFGVRVVI